MEKLKLEIMDESFRSRIATQYAEAMKYDIVDFMPGPLYELVQEDQQLWREAQELYVHIKETIPPGIKEEFNYYLKKICKPKNPVRMQHEHQTMELTQQHNRFALESPEIEAAYIDRVPFTFKAEKLRGSLGITVSIEHEESGKLWVTNQQVTYTNNCFTADLSSPNYPNGRYIWKLDSDAAPSCSGEVILTDNKELYSFIRARYGEYKFINLNQIQNLPTTSETN